MGNTGGTGNTGNTGDTGGTCTSLLNHVIDSLQATHLLDTLCSPEMEGAVIYAFQRS